MIADELRPGDTFVCYSDAEWAEMSASERKRARRTTVEYRLSRSCIGKVHLRTSAGTWCMPKVAPVVLVGVEKAKNNPGAFAKRAPAKAA